MVSFRNRFAKQNSRDSLQTVHVGRRGGRKRVLVNLYWSEI